MEAINMYPTNVRSTLKQTDSPYILASSDAQSLMGV